jgi:3-hydroxyisobutyrate dehydrogenase-like beta-hydroxyacid dehydrogenase
MPEPTSTPTAGVIGLGMMGSGIAVTLDAAGLLGAAYDVQPAVFDSFPQLVDRSRPTAADLAASVDVAFLVVVDRAQLEDVLFSAGGVVEGAHPGLVACLCSTVTAADVEELAARAADSGLTLVDVGIAGGPDAAASGNLLTTIGADDEVYERIRPCLEAMSVRAIHAGPLGAGMKLKLVKNALSFMTMCAVHEALLLGEELGFSSQLVKEVAADSNLVDHFFWFPMGRPSARPYGSDVDAKMLGANRHFADLARKDVAAAAAAADSVGMDHPVMDLTIAQAARYFLLPED